jgi:hypothetical protein
MVVSQVWQGMAARIFLSFGKLSNSNYTLPSGRAGHPRGEWQLINAHSLTDWQLALDNRLLATSDSRSGIRESRLQRLLGRRLLSVQIDAQSLSTQLNFTRQLALTTKAMPRTRERLPHWLLLSSEKSPALILRGTGTRWHGKTGSQIAFG